MLFFSNLKKIVCSVDHRCLFSLSILFDLFDQEEEESDDEDDTAELLAELQKIKKERASEKAKMVSPSISIGSQGK